MASGRTEWELPGSEDRSGAGPGGLTVPGGGDETAAFPSGRASPYRARPRPVNGGWLGSGDVTMPGGTAGPWDVAAYTRFSDERSRPFLDLVARVPSRSPGPVVDMGCGEGTMTAALADRWPGARVTGVDSSAEMLGAARPVPGRVEFVRADVREWQPAAPVDVVVSNAVLHWVPRHEDLLVAWAGWLAPGGVLAVQVPGNWRAPSHALLDALCRSPRWADRLADAGPRPDTVLEPAEYADLVSAAGLEPDVWETTYLHRLSGSDPVLAWVRSTVLRPVLARLPGDDATAFTAEYAAALRTAYPERRDGTTLLPFRRIFVVGTRIS